MPPLPSPPLHPWKLCPLWLVNISSSSLACCYWAPKKISSLRWLSACYMTTHVGAESHFWFATGFIQCWLASSSLFLLLRLQFFGVRPFSHIDSAEMKFIWNVSLKIWVQSAELLFALCLDHNVGVELHTAQSNRSLWFCLVRAFQQVWWARTVRAFFVVCGFHFKLGNIKLKSIVKGLWATVCIWCHLFYCINVVENETFTLSLSRLWTFSRKLLFLDLCQIDEVW